MGKKFFDVFPTLKLDTGLKDLYEQVTVEKVSSIGRTTAMAPLPI